jgi:hypothetical protein
VAGLCHLAKSSGFDIQKVVFDSTSFQFWGTELYKRNKPLKGSDPKSAFSEAELLDFEKKAQMLNRTGKGDQACFYFSKSYPD